MFNPNDNKLLIPTAMVLVAALIFGAAVVYLVGSNGHAPGGSAYVPPSPAGAGPATLPPGTPNPALSLPHVSAIHVVGGIAKTISASNLQILSTQDGALQTFTPSKDTVIYQPGAQKDPTAYAKELSAFQAALQYSSSADGTFEAPEPYVDAPIALTDIPVGALVNVTTGSTTQDTSIHVVSIEMLSANPGTVKQVGL